jgi:hypothetical protein
MTPPPGIAKFDSASAMAMALARFLEGRDFVGLGQSRLLQALVRHADWLPRPLRERTFAYMGAQEGIAPEKVERANMAQVAEWLTSLYPRRRYPALMVGSSNGALVHIGAALGAPWLPQTVLTLIDQKHVHPDDPVHAMEAEKDHAQRFLAANPNVQLHHLHDPNQDRLMLGLITYYRSKYLRLPRAYRDFIEHSVMPSGTLYLVDCERRWPTKRLGDRYVYQFGAEGGPTTAEYFHGSDRVADYLARYGSPVRRWEPPAPDGDSPEAEWGFEPALRADVLDVAHRHGYRVVRIAFEDPEHPSALVAELYRAWYRERGLPADRLVIESFVLHEPHWVLRTGSVPYWMTFNMQPSLDKVHRYLDYTEPYDEIYLMLFAHGVDSVGLPPIDAWRQLLQRARKRGAFLDLNPNTYPAHFAHFARYSQALRQQVNARYPFPAPMSPARVERFIEQHGERHGVRLETLS